VTLASEAPGDQSIPDGLHGGVEGALAMESRRQAVWRTHICDELWNRKKTPAESRCRRPVVVCFV